MADNKYLDDSEDESEETTQPDNSGRNRIILFAVLGVLLVALSVGGTLLAVKLLGPEPAPAAPVAETGETATIDEDAEESDAEAALQLAESDSAAAKKPAIYYPITPPLIVNFDARGRQRFLQVEIALMTRDNDVVNAIDLHMSMIRNSLILLIGSHLYEELQTAEGKELLRQQCLQEMQRLMEQEIGRPGIEQVLFTNFVMQ